METNARRVVLSHVSTVEADHVNIAAIGHVTRMSVIDVDAVDHVILIATDTVKDHVIAVEALSDVIAAEADLVNEHARIEAEVEIDPTDRDKSSSNSNSIS